MLLTMAYAAPPCHVKPHCYMNSHASIDHCITTPIDVGFDVILAVRFLCPRLPERTRNCTIERRSYMKDDDMRLMGLKDY